MLIPKCHAEFISASITKILKQVQDDRMLKQVQDDISTL